MGAKKPPPPSINAQSGLDKIIVKKKDHRVDLLMDSNRVVRQMTIEFFFDDPCDDLKMPTLFIGRLKV